MGTDCPATGGPYWHFVLAPNNNTRSFLTITLNLKGTIFTFSGSQIIPNGTQTDNVFIQVPAGYLLTDLLTTGSSATYTGPAANRFNLSHVCVNYTGAAVLGATVTNTDVQAGTGEAQVLAATAVSPSGSLPYAGSSSSIPLAQLGVVLLAVGALVTFAIRRRTHTSGA